jgi:predicted branched-subunit amino acid permease
MKRYWFQNGIKDGIPIGLGYFAVSFSLGIAAKQVGITAVQAAFMSLTNLTSAGQFAGLGIIASGASYMEIALSQLIINLRYCLMSCALSQKIDRKEPFFHRFLVAYGVTDEIFGVSVRQDVLSPYYSYGVMSMAVPGWTLGTFLGVICGQILPLRVVSALSVALYGMFLAVVIPPARDNKVLAGLIPISMGASLIFTVLPIGKMISSGMRIILLTIVLSLAAALLFPVSEEEKEESHDEA